MIHSHMYVMIDPIGSENIYVSQLLQKAKIEVSEDGTKASAATSKYLFDLNHRKVLQILK